MPQNKTLPTDVDPMDFLSGLDAGRRQDDGFALDTLFREVTGFEPVMWGNSILGYGRYRYRYESVREGTSLATGFSPRKASLSIYIMPGYADFGHLLKKLGKHKLGQSCLYINKLDDVDLGVLEQLIRAGLDDLGARWPIDPGTG